jgi:membrane-bound ClpP family serine protease
LWPFELKDERIVDVQLTPEPVVPNDALIASAEQLRLQASQGVAVAPPPTIGPMQPITIPTTPNSSVPFSTTPSPSNQVYPNLPATSQPFNPNPPILGPVYP